MYELRLAGPYLQQALGTSFQPIFKKKHVTENISLLNEA